jgi:autotransporter translocation and assembly factor TamB
MRTRPTAVLCLSLAAMSLAATTAFATDTPAPGALQPAPPLAALPGVLGKCADKNTPKSAITVKAARSAARSRVLKGTASDKGCGLAFVTISIARKQHGKCRFLQSNGRLRRAGTCKKDRYLTALGTKKWKVGLQKLPKGTYRIRTRAIDLAGNVQKPRTRNLKLR